LPGKPDIVLPKYHVAILIHGCFWHRHPNCKFAYNPKSNVDFWQKKFEGNIERDAKKQEALLNAGWKVILIWECEIKNLEVLEKKLKTEINVK
jgi:DNA mismatch endonuclease (patch repair protein)